MSERVSGSSDAEPLSVNELEMAGAAMREWDRNHKAGVRDWPTMFVRVYRAMQAEDAASPRAQPSTGPNLPTRVLAVLRSHPGEWLPVGDLAEEIYGGPRPKNYRASLRVAVQRARELVAGEAKVLSSGDGSYCFVEVPRAKRVGV